MKSSMTGRMATESTQLSASTPQVLLRTAAAMVPLRIHQATVGAFQRSSRYSPPALRMTTIRTVELRPACTLHYEICKYHQSTSKANAKVLQHLSQCTTPHVRRVALLNVWVSTLQDVLKTAAVLVLVQLRIPQPSLRRLQAQQQRNCACTIMISSDELRLACPKPCQHSSMMP